MATKLKLILIIAKGSKSSNFWPFSCVFAHFE